MSKNGVFSGPYFPVFGPEKTPYFDTFHAVTSFHCFSEWLDFCASSIYLTLLFSLAYKKTINLSLLNYVPYVLSRLRALITRLVRLICYLCALLTHSRYKISIKDNFKYIYIYIYIYIYNDVCIYIYIYIYIYYIYIYILKYFDKLLTTSYFFLLFVCTW